MNAKIILDIKINKKLKASAYLESLAEEARKEFLGGTSSGSFTSVKKIIKKLKDRN